MIKNKACLFFHSWKLDTTKSTSITNYYECSFCGERKIVVNAGGYQPIDVDWLNNI